MTNLPACAPSITASITSSCAATAPARTRSSYAKPPGNTYASNARSAAEPRLQCTISASRPAAAQRALRLVFAVRSGKQHDRDARASCRTRPQPSRRSRAAAPTTFRTAHRADVRFRRTRTCTRPSSRRCAARRREALPANAMNASSSATSTRKPHVSANAAVRRCCRRAAIRRAACRCARRRRCERHLRERDQRAAVGDVVRGEHEIRRVRGEHQRDLALDAIVGDRAAASHRRCRADPHTPSRRGALPAHR